MTQTQWVLDRLQAGEKLTAMDAMKRYGVARLAARVMDLKDSGYKINKEMVEAINRRGEAVKVARYFMGSSKMKHTTGGV